jgi:hypothetical protein
MVWRQIVMLEFKAALRILPALLLVACEPSSGDRVTTGSVLAIGTWGGDSAGVIATDSVTHVHIGCTFGDIPRRLQLDANGQFSQAGSFLLRAYPVAVGPTMPAQFSGRVTNCSLTIVVSVNDTIAKTTVVRGPVTVRLGDAPKLANCPICHTPGDRARLRLNQ